MTRRKAIQILIQAASNDIHGSGKGIRSTTETWRREVEIAIEKLFLEAFGWKMSESDKYNLF